MNKIVTMSLRGSICLGMAASICLLSGCLHFRQSTWKLTSREEMRKAVLEHVPLGTNVNAAQKFMEAEGFSCRLERNGSFQEKTWWGDHPEPHSGIDFLRCKRHQSAGFLMTTFWSVALVLEGETVSDVLVSHCYDGL